MTPSEQAFLASLREAAEACRELVRECQNLAWRIYVDVVHPELREWDNEMTNCYPNWPAQPKD